MKFSMLGYCAILSVLSLSAKAAPITYDFTGNLVVYGSSQAYTGTLTYDPAALGVTTYYDGTNVQEMQGYGTVYGNAISNFTITTAGGETVTQIGTAINVFNLEESKYAISKGHSLLTFPLLAGGGGASGNINGTKITGLYLSFYDVNGFVDTSGLLPNGPSVTPGINPALTGTTLPLSLPFGSYFLGMNYGLTNQVNSISSWTLRTAPVPVPSAIWLFSSGILSIFSLIRLRKSR